MADNTFDNTVESLFKGMENFISSKTVVGDWIKVDDSTMILPLVEVSFGVGAGASKEEKRNNSGGGMGGKMSPSAVLVIHDGITRLVNVKNQDTVSKLIDMVPEVIEKFKKKDNEDPEVEKAVDEALGK